MADSATTSSAAGAAAASDRDTRLAGHSTRHGSFPGFTPGFADDESAARPGAAAAADGHSTLSGVGASVPASEQDDAVMQAPEPWVHGAGTVNRFGFVVVTPEDASASIPEETAAAAPTPVSREEARRENARVEKWRTMLARWGEFTRRSPNTIKRRVRKGIPDALRGIIWPVLTGGDQLARNHPGRYRRLLLAAPREDDFAVITADLTRTYPHHVQFQDRDGVGQKALMRVLRAYAAYDRDLGYCQGMAFVTALLLTYMPEEMSFWTLVALLRRRGLRGVFLPQLPLYMEHVAVLEALLQRLEPALWRTLDTEKVGMSMFATQWILTLFSHSFPFDFVVRVFDVFCLEGHKASLRTILGVLRHVRPKIVNMRFETLLKALRACPATLPVAEVIDVSFSLRITSAEIMKHRAAFRSSSKGQTVRRNCGAEIAKRRAVAAARTREAIEAAEAAGDTERVAAWEEATRAYSEDAGGDDPESEYWAASAGHWEASEAAAAAVGTDTEERRQERRRMARSNPDAGATLAGPCELPPVELDLTSPWVPAVSMERVHEGTAAAAGASVPAPMAKHHNALPYSPPRPFERPRIGATTDGDSDIRGSASMMVDSSRPAILLVPASPHGGRSSGFTAPSSPGAAAPFAAVVDWGGATHRRAVSSTQSTAQTLDSSQLLHQRSDEHVTGPHRLSLPPRMPALTATEPTRGGIHQRAATSAAAPHTGAMRVAHPGGLHGEASHQHAAAGATLSALSSPARTVHHTPDKRLTTTSIHATQHPLVHPAVSSLRSSMKRSESILLSPPRLPAGVSAAPRARPSHRQSHSRRASLAASSASATALVRDGGPAPHTPQHSVNHLPSLTVIRPGAATEPSLRTSRAGLPRGASRSHASAGHIDGYATSERSGVSYAQSGYTSPVTPASTPSAISPSSAVSSMAMPSFPTHVPEEPSTASASGHPLQRLSRAERVAAAAAAAAAAASALHGASPDRFTPEDSETGPMPIRTLPVSLTMEGSPPPMGNGVSTIPSRRATVDGSIVATQLRREQRQKARDEAAEAPAVAAAAIWKRWGPVTPDHPQGSPTASAGAATTVSAGMSRAEAKSRTRMLAALDGGVLPNVGTDGQHTSLQHQDEEDTLNQGDFINRSSLHESAPAESVATSNDTGVESTVGRETVRAVSASGGGSAIDTNEEEEDGNGATIVTSDGTGGVSTGHVTSVMGPTPNHMAESAGSGSVMSHRQSGSNGSTFGMDGGKGQTLLAEAAGGAAAVGRTEAIWEAVEAAAAAAEQAAETRRDAEQRESEDGNDDDDDDMDESARNSAELMPVIPALDSDSDSASDNGQLTPHLTSHASITGWDRLQPQSAPGSTSTPPVRRHPQRERLASPSSKGRGQRASSQQLHHPTIATGVHSSSNNSIVTGQSHSGARSTTAAASAASASAAARSSLMLSPASRRSRAGSDSATAATTTSGSVGPFSLRALPVDGGDMVRGERVSGQSRGDGAVRASWAGAWVLPQRRQQPSEPTHMLLPGGKRATVRPGSTALASPTNPSATVSPSLPLNTVGGSSTRRNDMHLSQSHSFPHRHPASPPPRSLTTALDDDAQEESASRGALAHSTGSWKHPQPRTRAVATGRP